MIDKGIINSDLDSVMINCFYLRLGKAVGVKKRALFKVGFDSYELSCPDTAQLETDSQQTLLYRIFWTNCPQSYNLWSRFVCLTSTACEGS